MKLNDFPESNVAIAKDQPEYQTLYAYKVPNDLMGRTVTRWKLSWKERLKLLFTGVLWHEIATFNQSLQPQYLSVHKDETSLPSDEDSKPNTQKEGGGV